MARFGYELSIDDYIQWGDALEELTLPSKDNIHAYIDTHSSLPQTQPHAHTHARTHALTHSLTLSHAYNWTNSYRFSDYFADVARFGYELSIDDYIQWRDALEELTLTSKDNALYPLLHFVLDDLPTKSRGCTLVCIVSVFGCMCVFLCSVYVCVCLSLHPVERRTRGSSPSPPRTTPSIPWLHFVLDDLPTKCRGCTLVCIVSLFGCVCVFLCSVYVCGCVCPYIQWRDALEELTLTSKDNALYPLLHFVLDDLPTKSRGCTLVCVRVCV